MRTPLIAGNWKMNKTVGEARTLVEELHTLVRDAKAEVLVCPPSTALHPLQKVLEPTNIGLGAQNMYFEKEGAYTGEISPLMLKEIGVSYVLLGHSERRAIFKEKDEEINKKVKLALEDSLIPILCIGETLAERKAGDTENVVKRQLKEGMKGVEVGQDLVIAYEPVWAIGTGESATSTEANRVIALIREYLHELQGSIAQKIRILYGGSVSPDTIDELMAQEDIDGALVGGASLHAEKFARIVNFHA